MRDGAGDALSGYLYQFIQVAALRAASMLRVSARESYESGDELSCKLIAKVGRGRLIHEHFGQDAIIRIDQADADETVAIQFKSSRSATGAKMDMAELIEILRSFDASQREASKEGPAIDRFVIITSKILDETSRSVIRRRHDPKLPSELSQRVRKSLPWVLRDYGTRDYALKALQAVLARLEDTIENARIEKAVKQIEIFAKHLGLREPEIRGGIGKVISSMLTRAAQEPLSITKEWLKECFTGVPDARVLHLAAQGDTARTAGTERLEQELSRQFGATTSELIQRDYIQRLREQVARFPIVFLIGQGGCGKTVLAVQYLLEESTKRLVIMLGASKATSDQCVGLEIRRLRSKEYYHSLQPDPIPTVVDRLRIANEDAEPPYLLIDLDGLDEASEHVKSNLIHVIEHFWERESVNRPNAVLLLTCRATSRDPSQTIKDLISAWLGTEYPQTIEDMVGRVPIGDFDEQEILRAARKLDGDLFIRIESVLKRPAPRSPLFDLVPRGFRRDPRLATIVQSLHHPAMWGVFAKLGKDERTRAIEGESIVLNRLASEFIDRFCRKANQRRPILTPDHIKDALRSISSLGSSDNPPRDKQTDWMHASRGPLNDNQADLLYNEARSYGLIEEDQEGWRWRHTLVYDWLRTGAT
jgi:hypothetical protein